MLTSVVRGRNHRKETGSKVRQRRPARERESSAAVAPISSAAARTNLLTSRGDCLSEDSLLSSYLPPPYPQKKREEEEADWSRNPAEFNAVKRIQVPERKSERSRWRSGIFFFFPVDAAFPISLNGFVSRCSSLFLLH